MANPPIYGARHRTTCVPGASTSTTVKMLVSCMDNPATPVTVTCNGVTYTSGVEFTLDAYGVAWTGQLTVTGLTAFTEYSWAVTQGAESDAGSLTTSPEVRDDFSLFFASCDNNTKFSNTHVSQNPETVTGMWGYIKDYAVNGALPVAGMLFIDDYGYVDGLNFTDDFNDAGGLSSQAPEVGTDNTVSLAWLSMLGSTGAATTPLYSDLDTTTKFDDLMAHFGREENRAWCRKNINLFPQWGDHEFASDIGYTSNSQTAGNTRWTTYQVTPGIGANAWNAFIGKCQPPTAQNLDAYANHWSFSLGSLFLATVDEVTNADGSFSSHSEAPVQMTEVYGTNQIDDILADLTTSTAAFKVLALPNGIRYLQQGTASLNAHLAQYPLFNQCVAEYKRLFTDSTSSLMRNANTNGVAGNLVTIGGDLHRACVTLNHSDEDTGIQGESYEHWQTGTVNGSANFANSTGLDSGDEFVGTDGKTKAKLLYDEPDKLSTGDKRFHAIRCDVYGSENPKRMVMTLIDRDGVEVYSRQYIHSQGNISKPVGTPSQTQSIGADE